VLYRAKRLFPVGDDAQLKFGHVVVFMIYDAEMTGADSAATAYPFDGLDGGSWRTGHDGQSTGSGYHVAHFNVPWGAHPTRTRNTLHPSVAESVNAVTNRGLTTTPDVASRLLSPAVA
jgi:hypothetical protein